MARPGTYGVSGVHSRASFCVSATLVGVLDCHFVTARHGGQGSQDDGRIQKHLFLSLQKDTSNPVENRRRRVEVQHGILTLSDASVLFTARSDKITVLLRRGFAELGWKPSFQMVFYRFAS